MRVLQVVHQFLPQYTGGTELYVADLSRRLRERGHDVALFAGGDVAAHASWEELELTTVTGGIRGPRGPVRTLLASFARPEAEDAFREAMRRFRPEVVHFHHLLGLSGRLPRLARAEGIPTCYTLHDYWFVCPKSQLIDHAGALCRGPAAGLNCGVCAAERLGHLGYAVGAPLVAPVFALRQRLVRRSISMVDAILAPSQFVADFAVRKGLPGDKMIRVDFGVAEPEVSVAPRLPRMPGSPLRVTYLGAISWSKGVHVLVEACRELGQGVVEVRVYGDLAVYPDYAEGLQQQARGTPVCIMGPASRESIPELFATTDVLVVPSLWYENSPLVISEAFAASVPVVASRVGALAEKVRDGVDGLLFTMGDARALARALRELAEQPDLLEGLRTGIAHAVTRDQHVSHMERIYASLVAPSSQREQVH